MDPRRSPEMVVLYGLSVPRSALQLLLDLEAAGFTFAVTPDDVLEVRPRGRLTPELTTAIRDNKDFLVSLVRYTGPPH